MTEVVLPNTTIKSGYLGGEDDWGDDMNSNLRILDALVQLVFLSRTETAPPDSPNGGDVYLVAAGGEDDWDMQDGMVAIWQQGDDTGGGWIFVEPKAGWRAYVADQGKFTKLTSDGWIDDTSGGSYDTPLDDVIMEPDSNGLIARFTSDDPKTVTFDDASSEYAEGMIFRGRNVGAGLLTIAVGGTFVMNKGAGGLLEVPQGGSFEVLIANASEGDLTIESAGTHVVTDTTTAATATPENAGRYTRFTHASAKTYTFDSANTYDVGAVYSGRVIGAAALTLVEAGSFVINRPAGVASLVLPTATPFKLVIVGPAEADLIVG